MSLRSMVLWLCNQRKAHWYRHPGLLMGMACLSLFGCSQDDGSVAPDLSNAPAIENKPTEVGLRQSQFSTLPPPTIEVAFSSPTPLPSATPTPSPTPIVYMVQSGDTFLGIAIENQTTVEQIQALNPEARPELLSIGQKLVLPPPATPVFRGEAPTPLPISAEIVSYAVFPDGGGGVWVVGEVKNSSEWFLEKLSLEITLFSENGQLAAQAVTQASLPLIPPGQTSPFAVLFPQKPAGDVQADVTLLEGFVNATTAETQPARLETQEVEFSQEGKLVMVSGQITRVEGAPIGEAKLYATLHDGSGRVIGFAKTVVGLSRGDDSGFYTFELQAFALQGEVATVLIIAEPVLNK